MKGFIITVCCLCSLSVAAQKQLTPKATQPLVVPADTVPAIINYTEESGLIKFSSLLRPLRQIAGAPEPFYTYFWEFGDGHFSFEPNPEHSYKDVLLHNVRLFATNSYDDGKPPPSRPKPIKPGGTRPILAAVPSSFKSTGAIELKSNCMPRPGEDMILLVGYRNKRENGIENLSGTLSLMYNDKEFSKDNFQLIEGRAYHGEKKTIVENKAIFAAKNILSAEGEYYASLDGADLPLRMVKDPEQTAALKANMSDFKNVESWKFDGLKSGEERYLFVQFKTTPDMIKDTNATVRLTGIFTPDQPLAETELFTLELQIVASHDPNKMMLSNSRMNYRFVGKKRQLTYKVRFQNTGKGPAKKVDVGVVIPENLDASTIKILDSKPKLISIDSAYSGQSALDTIKTADSVHFVFQNIYLPGTKQKGVKDLDSTMGYIQYSIGFKEKPKKLPFKSGAAIIFDKNEPIYTNRAAGRYKMGLSPGLIAGYGFPFENGNTPMSGQRNLSFGLSLAPYAPHRYYWQVELYASSFAEKEYLVKRTPGDGSITVIQNANGERQEARILHRDSTVRSKVLTLNLVPLQLRRNFNKYIGAGMGALVSMDIQHENTPGRSAATEFLKTGDVQTLSQQFDKFSNSFSNVQQTLFADVQVGKVHVGPSIGFRYLFTFQQSNSRMVTYLTWKF